MPAVIKDLARQARKYWERRDFASLEKLRRKPFAASNSEALYFIGLGLNAQNKKREAIECSRKASDLDPQNEDVIRTLGYELVDQVPLEAAELFNRLVGMRRASGTTSPVSANCESGKTASEKRTACWNRPCDCSRITVLRCSPWPVFTLRSRIRP